MHILTSIHQEEVYTIQGTITVSPNPASPSDTVIVTYCAPDYQDISIVITKNAGPPFLDSPPQLISPSGMTFTDKMHPMPFLIPAGMCHDTVINTDFSVVTPLEAGKWRYLSDVDLTGDDAADLTMVEFFDVSFYVLPETAIGAIGVVGASIAILAVFIYRRQKTDL